MKDIIEGKMNLIAFVKDIGDFTLVLPSEEISELILVRGSKIIRASSVKISEFKGMGSLRTKIQSILTKKLGIEKGRVSFSYSSNSK